MGKHLSFEMFQTSSELSSIIGKKLNSKYIYDYNSYFIYKKRDLKNNLI